MRGRSAGIAVAVAVAVVVSGLVLFAPKAAATDPLPKVVATIPVGSGPYLSHYAALTATTWIGNYNSNNVSVISDASLTVVKSVYAGHPTGVDVAEFGANGTVWIGNRTGNKVEVVNETSYKIYGNVSVGTAPERLETEPTLKEEWVANYGSANLSVVNITSRAVIHTIALGGGAGTHPYGVTWDSGRSLMWITEEGPGRVLAFYPGNYSIAYNVSAHGSHTGGICYDPEGAVWVANDGSNNVTELSDVNGSLLHTVHVGTAPYAPSCDTNSGRVFVGNEGSANVTVITEENATKLTTLQVGTNPYGTRAFDPVLDYVLVPNFGSDNVSVIADGVPQVAAPGIGVLVVGIGFVGGLLILLVLLAPVPYVVHRHRRGRRDPYPGGFAGMPARKGGSR